MQERIDYESDHQTEIRDLNEKITELKLRLNDLNKNTEEYKEKVSEDISTRMKT